MVTSLSRVDFKRGKMETNEMISSSSTEAPNDAHDSHMQSDRGGVGSVEIRSNDRCF